MHVVSGVSVCVLNFNQVPRSTFQSGKNYAPFANRLHRSAGRRRIINAKVWTVFFQNRMQAMFAEMRRNRRSKLERRVQKRLLHRLPFRREIRGSAGDVMKK